MTLSSSKLSSMIKIKDYFVYCRISIGNYVLFVVINLCFQISVTISNDPFKKIALCMCYIVIYRKIMSPSTDHKGHNITYMLCIFSCILSNGW
jgi:hypothetical protein